MSLPWQLALGNDTPTTVATAAGRVQMVGPQFLNISGGASGQVLMTDGAAHLSWANAGTGGPGGSNPPGGSLNQVQINAGAGNFGGITMSGDATWDTTSGALAIGAGRVTLAQMQNRSASILIGRGNSGAGAPQEITIGANLTLTGTVLAATGGGSVSITTSNAGLTVSPSPLTGTGTISLAVPVTVANGGTGNTAAGTVGGVHYFSTTAQLSSTAAGATNTVLHGSPTAPTWGQVNLASEVTGNLPVGNLAGGSGATSTTYWRGDGSWGTPTGGAANPGGSANQLQYNSAGTAFAGTPGLTVAAGGASIASMNMSIGTTPATGDLYYRAAGGAYTQLTIGSGTQVLGVSGGVPAWVAGGNVSSVPTPAQYQIATWNSGSTILGRASYTFDGTYFVLNTATGTPALPTIAGGQPIATVVGADTFSTRLAIYTYGNASGSALSLVSGGGTANGQAALPTGNPALGLIQFLGQDSATTVAQGARIRAISAESVAWGSANPNHGTDLILSTTPVGAGGAITDVVTFKADGGVMIPSAVTGGSLGAGIINATGLAVAGTRVYPGFCESAGWTAGASPNNAIVWVNNTGRTVTIQGITGTPEVVNGSAATVSVVVVASTSSVQSGTGIGTAFDANATAYTNQSLGGAGTTVANGSRVGLKQVGTPTWTNSVATITVFLQ